MKKKSKLESTPARASSNPSPKKKIRTSRRVGKKNLAVALNDLERGELVRRLTAPELEYVFKHVLTQESAYSTLLVKTRREIHRQVAASIETLYPDRLDEFAALLARHYAEAGEPDKTLDYSTRAGDAAARVYANAEAIEHYTRALELAKQLGAPVSNLYRRRGRVFQLAGNFDKALDNYDEMEHYAREHEDQALELAALLEHMTVHSAPTAKFDTEHAQALGAQALSLARALHDRPAEAKILWNLSLVDFFQGQLQGAIEHGEAGLAIARELNLREQMAFSLNDLHNPYVVLGKVERAQQVITAARELWRELDNKPMLADNLITSAESYYLTGEYDQALALLQEGNRIAESIGNLWGQSYSRMNQSFLFRERGEFDLAIRALEEGVTFGDQAGFLVASVALRAFLAYTYSQLGALDRAIEYARTSLSYGDKIPGWGNIAYAVLALVHIQRGELDLAEQLLRDKTPEHARDRVDPYISVYFWLGEGELRLARGELQRALASGQEMLKELITVNSLPYRADALLVQARALRGLGRIDEALEALTQARANAEQPLVRRILWEILAETSEILSERGDETQARELRQRANAELDILFAHIPTAELRESFSNLPKVKSVRGET